MIFAIALSLTSCHRLVSRVEFVVDGEVVNTHVGPSSGLNFLAIEREGYDFAGWYTAEGGEGERVSKENVGDYFGFLPILKLYAHFVEKGIADDNPSDNDDTENPDNTEEPEIPSEPDAPDNPSNPGDDENLDNIEPGDPWDDIEQEDPNENDGSNVDNGGWT